MHIWGTAISAHEVEWCGLIGGCECTVHVRKRSRTTLKDAADQKSASKWNHTFRARMQQIYAHFREDGQRYEALPHSHKGGRN